MKKYVAICGTVAALTWVGSGLAVSGSAMPSSAGPATSDRGQAPGQAAAYYLLGDTTNSGGSATKFNTTAAGNPWSFFASGLSATTLYSSCPNGTACWGVQGIGTGIGVYGSASNPTGSDSRGVQGSGGSTAASGTSYGGYFSASNSASGGKSNGVYGAGSTTGVYATSSGNGVYATSTGGSGNAVYAKGSGSSFYGVWGDVGGNGYGIVGSSSGGSGVYGSSTGSTGAANVAGVYGYESLSSLGSASATNSGVFGTCANCNGLFGTSANFTGVRGSATGGGANTYGGYFSSTKGTGIYVTTGGITALRAVNPNKAKDHYAAIFDGNVRINGSYTATGTKSALVQTTGGDRLMYAEEATQNFFSDQGMATLSNGRAIVTLDSLFAETVNLSKPYMVIVTPLSFETTGLGVGNETSKGFEVRELNHGKGNFSFSWRVTALRKGYETDRMNTAPTVPSSDASALPTGPSSTDTPVTDSSVAPPTSKAPPPAQAPSEPATK